MNSLILLAGGSGKRAQQHIPKQFIELDGEKKTRLMFLQYPYSNVKSINFDEVIIVTPSEWKDIITKELSCTNINVTCKVVEGGYTRSESSYLGLQACSLSCKKVLIHDAARPFVSKEIYNSGNTVDGAFFLSASYGFKGRLLSERKKWRSAAFAGRNAIKYLKEIREDDIMIPEISFGNGLFNYYSVWISERYPILKPIIKLFPTGDKLNIE